MKEKAVVSGIVIVALSIAEKALCLVERVFTTCQQSVIAWKTKRDLRKKCMVSVANKATVSLATPLCSTMETE